MTAVGPFDQINEIYLILDSALVLYFRKKHKVVRMYSYLETEERKYSSNSDAFIAILTDCI